jgi:hypothetical protein
LFPLLLIVTFVTCHHPRCSSLASCSLSCLFLVMTFVAYHCIVVCSCPIAKWGTNIIYAYHLVATCLTSSFLWWWYFPPPPSMCKLPMLKHFESYDNLCILKRWDCFSFSFPLLLLYSLFIICNDLFVCFV